MFPGNLALGESFFAPGEKAAIIEYSSTSLHPEPGRHELSGFREELREIYPGVWLGKQFALPGSTPYGLVAIPASSSPVFAFHYLLFSNRGSGTVAEAGAAERGTAAATTATTIALLAP